MFSFEFCILQVNTWWNLFVLLIIQNYWCKIYHLSNLLRSVKFDFVQLWKNPDLPHSILFGSKKVCKFWWWFLWSVNERYNHKWHKITFPFINLNFAWPSVITIFTKHIKTSFTWKNERSMLNDLKLYKWFSVQKVCIIILYCVMG